jgi:hypothetical protein
MMQHLLIPTDFSLQSLNAVHGALATRKNEEYKITLFHLLSMPVALPDLIFRPFARQEQKSINKDFLEACEIIQNKYGSRIKSLKVKFAYGDTVAYLRNYLEGEKVDKIVLVNNIQFVKPYSHSVDCIRLLRKTGFPIDILPEKIVSDAAGSSIELINMAYGNNIKVKHENKEYAAQN